MINTEFLAQIMQAEFWPPTDIYGYGEMESNDTRLARIADFEANVESHQQSVLSAEDWESLVAEGGGVGCKIGCLLPYVICRRECSGSYPCSAICDAQLQNCFNGCNQQ